MSEENVEFALAWIDRWNAGERPGFAEEQVHPDAVLVSRGIMAGHPRHGPEGFREWLREIDEQFDEWTLSVEEVRDAGDCVAALGHVHFHGRQQDIASDFAVGVLVEIRDGQVVRMETFVENPADALEAVGVRE